MLLLFHPNKKGRSKQTSVSFVANHAGQDGRDYIKLLSDDGSYGLIFQTQEEVTELLRQAALVRMNRKEVDDTQNK